MPTNAQLHELLEALTTRVKAIEERMKNYEIKADAHGATLERIETTINTVALIGKWLLVATNGVLVIVVAYWLLTVLHIHP